jgi:hypothetical protein
VADETSDSESQTRAHAPPDGTDERSVDQPTSSTYFDVDTTLDRRSRKGRGFRTTTFSEEFGYETLLQQQEVIGECFALATITGEPTDIATLVATSDPDTLYFDQAMKKNDAAAFLEAAHKDFQNLLDRGVFEIIQLTLSQMTCDLFSSVWAMKRKRRVRTREVYKYKARLNLDGSQMQPG